MSNICIKEPIISRIIDINPDETRITIPPNPCNINNNECIICRDETKHTHKCQQCTKGSWRICQKCRQTLDNKPCPVCRNVTTNNIRSGRGVSGRRRTRNRTCLGRYTCLGSRTCQYLYTECLEILHTLYNLLMICTVFIICQYLGKLYYWVYCTGTCDEKSGNCICGKNARRDGYWIDFQYCIIEALLGLVLTAIFISCCCCCCIKQ